MARLPIPGSDTDTWGDILNEFLVQAHNTDGTVKDTGVVAAKADDTSVVHNSSDETIGGVKTFTSSPLVPTPTTGTQAANKTYVDGVVGAGAPDATTISKGIVQLAGDLGGTAGAPTVPGLAAKADASALTAHTGDTANPHAVTKAQVGLGSVDNTSDAAKNSAAATLTNKTIDADGTGNVITNIGASEVKPDIITGLTAETTIASDDVVMIYDTSATDLRKMSRADFVAGLGGGGLTDGDKGDITVSASGATWTIDNDAVSYAKIQNVSATDKVLGRSTAGAGDIEEITLTAAGRALIDDADAASQRTTLELGNVDNTSDATKNSATATLTNKRVTKRVVGLTDGANIATNSDNGDLFTVTLGGNRTMDNPTGTPTDGQQIMYRLKQDATGSRTITWGAAFRFSTDVASPTLTTTANKIDYVGFQYNAADSTWDCLAVARGY